jgi:hypothetical protein
VTTRYRVQLDVPRRGGWRAWGPARASFERALADPADPAIASAEIASEHRRGADYVRVTLVLAVGAADVADVLAIAWDAFRDAASDDLDGWEVTAAAAEVRPAPPLPGDGASSRAALSGVAVRDGTGPQRAGHQVVVHRHVMCQGEHVPAFLSGDGDCMRASSPAISSSASPYSPTSM